MKHFLNSAAAALALSIAAAPVASHACTSWMVFSDLTQNNTNILHKNRDSTSKNIIVLMSQAGAKRKWIALGSGDTNSGINSSGLAGAMNSGEKCVDPPNVKGKKSTPAMLHVILDSCDTAAQAVNKLQELIKAGDYSHGEKGSTFFFLDRNEGYVCEFTAKYCSVQRYTRGYTVRANIWQNPNMYELSRNSIKSHLNSSARAYIALSQLNAALDKNKKIALTDIVALSRHWEMPKESPEKRSVCFRWTNSVSSMEIDREFPDVLSAMYVTIGHPRHTVNIPVPICAEKLHPAMSDKNWSAASWKRLEKLGLGAPIPAEWSKFEADAMAKYADAKAKARQLLNNGKRAEAIKLLNTTAYGIWTQAEALLKPAAATTVTK